MPTLGAQVDQADVVGLDPKENPVSSGHLDLAHRRDLTSIALVQSPKRQAGIPVPPSPRPEQCPS
jgi:hypothetical protein